MNKYRNPKREPVAKPVGPRVPVTPVAGPLGALVSKPDPRYTPKEWEPRRPQRATRAGRLLAEIEEAQRKGDK